MADSGARVERGAAPPSPESGTSGAHASAEAALLAVMVGELTQLPVGEVAATLQAVAARTQSVFGVAPVTVELTGRDDGDHAEIDTRAGAGEDVQPRIVPADSRIAIALLDADGRRIATVRTPHPELPGIPAAEGTALLTLFLRYAGLVVGSAQAAARWQVAGPDRNDDRPGTPAAGPTDADTRDGGARSVSTAAATATAVLRTDGRDDGVLLRVDTAFATLLGYSVAELLGARWSELVHPDDAEFAERTVRALEGSPGTRWEGRMLRHDGTDLWVSLSASAIASYGGAAATARLYVEDITERRSRELMLEHQAAHDPLTGLPNRRALHRRLRTAVQHSRRSGRQGAVLFCDLDKFKQVNDCLGHLIGDAVLQEAAARLGALVRSTDMVARLGGDEFVVVAEDLDDDGVSRLVGRIREALRQPLRGMSDGLDVSVGWARIDGSVTDPDGLLHRADRAMYADKRGAPTRPRGDRPPVS